jgi:UDP-N-acetylglucosamine 2-epimerase (non-hydrolysing)/GDP/UDP-N,N'-diacetylbacillosamine 2-epimerase (hydrolysing)
MSANKRKICVVTASRAEYGLLYWVMKGIKDDPALKLQIVAAGMHLMPKYGSTYREIIKDGFKINARVDLKLNSDSEEGIARSLGLGITGFGKAFKRLRPDLVVLLGDRYEMLAAAAAAMVSRIPLAHIHGGEATFGVYDDAIRHAITKMAYLHFVSHPVYAQRVIQMGEDPRRVFNFGAPGLDNLRNLRLLSRFELEKLLGIGLDERTALVTFHPETLKKGDARRQIKNLLAALDKSGLNMIFTVPNADAENRVIFREIDKFTKQNPSRTRVFKSLGRLKYLSLLKHIGLMVGNSSSGVIEAPSFKLPVVNVGNRQKGRLQAGNVINVSDRTGAILKGIRRALSPGFKKGLAAISNPFGDGRASARIVRKLKTVKLGQLNKGFYDLK